MRKLVGSKLLGQWQEPRMFVWFELSDRWGLPAGWLLFFRITEPRVDLRILHEEGQEKLRPTHVYSCLERLHRRDQDVMFELYNEPSVEGLPSKADLAWWMDEHFEYIEEQAEELFHDRQNTDDCHSHNSVERESKCFVRFEDSRNHFERSRSNHKFRFARDSIGIQLEVI